MNKTLGKDKRAVFGLTAVQQFFAIILGIALLAYVIVVIMGTLAGNTILTQDSVAVFNEFPAHINTTGSYTLAGASDAGATGFAITGIKNGTTNGLGFYNFTVLTANATVSATGLVTNSSSLTWANVSLNYTYSRNSLQQNNLNGILQNTSSGITGFFSNISPVFSILAVLVIILVLVVLVRVVQAPSSKTPQL